MNRIIVPKDTPSWFISVKRQIERLVGRATDLSEHSVADLPPAEGTKRLIYVTDESGGAVPAFNDGTHWRRVSDRAILS